MNILLATESYWPNADGGAVFERQLAHALAARGHTVAIWAPGTSRSPYEEQDGDTLILRERSSLLLPNPKYRISLWSRLGAKRVFDHATPDVVHAHIAWKIGRSAQREAHARKIPFLATNHFMPENALMNVPGPDWIKRPFHKVIWKSNVAFHNRCDYVTSPTPTAIQLLEDNGLTAPHEAVSNGIDTTRFRPNLDTSSIRKAHHIPTNVPAMLYLGRADGEKRIDVILKALPDILTRTPVHFVMAGTGNAVEHLKVLATKLGVAEHVTFAGFIEDEEKAALYAAMDLFAIASPAELQSIVLLEAMASGLPVLATDVAALKELCRNGQNGFLFERGDHNTLAQHAVRILTEPGLKERFGLKSRQIVEQEHAFQRTADTFESLYAKLTTTH
ncbi:MAG: glycosyltransferase [Candidatus Andersenbacteria bacterium]|nr:glycosyltransferase [Candidatus Andersenbacteria bacterium]